MFGTSSFATTSFSSATAEASAVFVNHGTFGGQGFAEMPFASESLLLNAPPVIPPIIPPTTRIARGNAKYSNNYSAQYQFEQSQLRDHLLREEEELLIIMKVIALCC